ncbi:MAG: tetratricopeptide repeat protein [Spirochaetia bacterium]|nr:tetratricopeptide repeat protein [Spirochaetia bacterium]
MITKEQEELLLLYNEALALYKKRNFVDARELFKKALKINPDDGPSKLYLERCKEYIKHPPEDDWDGVFVMKTK